MLLWSGQAISSMGTQASTVALPFLVLLVTTGSLAQAGFIGAVRAVPYILFSLPAGALIDRWNRKRLMIACDVGRGIAVLSIPVAIWVDALTIWQLYAVSFIEGSLFVFFNIAEVASLPRVVVKEQLPEATAQNEAAFATANILAPSIGTFLYQTFG